MTWFAAFGLWIALSVVFCAAWARIGTANRRRREEGWWDTVERRQMRVKEE